MDWVERMGRRVKLRDLHVLLAVAESGSMVKAANRLAVSHPVVSKTISELEQALGVRLFDRHPQGVEATTYGHVLLRRGLSVFDELRQGLKELEFIANPNAGEVRIGGAEITMAGLLPDIAQTFCAQYPGVNLHVALANTGSLQFKELRERSLDLVIGRLPKQFSEDDLEAEVLFDEPFLAVVGVDTSWARKRRLALADLMLEPWVLPSYDSAPGELILEMFREAHLPPVRPSVTTMSAQLTVTLIASGRFVGVLPQSVARLSAERAGLKILPIDLPPVRIASGIVTVKGRTLSPLANRFLDFARDLAKGVPAMTKTVRQPATNLRRATRRSTLQTPKAAGSE